LITASDASQIFTIFEYYHNGGVAERFNRHRTEALVQLANIERAWGQPNQSLQSWWWAFTSDYLLQMESWAATYADRAIVAAAAPYLAARQAGRTLTTDAQVMPTLIRWAALIRDPVNNPLRFPRYNGQAPFPWPPANWPPPN
jgi:hypothetical protein